MINNYGIQRLFVIRKKGTMKYLAYETAGYTNRLERAAIWSVRSEAQEMCDCQPSSDEVVSLAEVFSHK